MNTNAITDFVSAVSDATSTDAVWSAATKAFASIGLEHVYYGVRPTISPERPVHLTMTETLGDWAEAYTAEGDFARDPLFAYNTHMPATFLTGPSFLSDYPFLTPEDLEVIDRGASFGFYSGAAMVMPHQGGEAVGGWHLVSPLGREEFLGVFRQNRALLEVSTAFAHREMEHHLTPAQPTRKLTLREAEVLKWLGAGYRTEQIAEVLGIRPVTVDLHLRNARKRLGARTREQALAIALSEGLIEL